MLPMPTFSKVIAFLGYYPYPVRSIGEKLLMLRRKHGWTLKQAARQIGCDQGSWRRWEKGKRITSSAHRKLVTKLLMRSEQGERRSSGSEGTRPAHHK